MKVIKDGEHGLLLNYFGLADKFYLSVAVMTFFAFPDPDQPLKDRELWPFIQGELGKNGVFDVGMPKPKGEVIVWGTCFAPVGKPVPGAQVSLQFGPLRKSLYVFGNRRWRDSAAGATISAPEPFVEMPVNYERAFGGKDFAGNPVGKGAAPVALPSGEEIRPLPNIEHPRHLIGSEKDRPEPAGFGPLNAAWPQRSKKLGTYDQKWLYERWPFYPEDMDWTYFNAAPEDQQMGVFCTGKETFAVTNMHKTKPLVESRLPNIRLRLFVNQLVDRDKPQGETIFREVHVHIDTVWLFPHAERGVTINRGSLPIADDEALDVSHIFIATEDPTATPKTIEEFHEEFKKRLERAIPPEAAALAAEAKEKLAEAAERLKDLPQEMMDAIDQGLGRAPVPVRTPEESLAEFATFLDRQDALINEGEKSLIEAKAVFGHAMKIDTSGFHAMREGLADAKATLQEFPAMLGKLAADSAAAKAEMQELYQKHMGRLDPKFREKYGIDLNMELDIFKKTPEDLWQEQGMRFIERCRNDLLSRQDYLNLMTHAGLRPYTIKRSWLGTHPTYETEDPALWGLPEENKERKVSGEVFLPPGIVIPTFQGAKLHRIRISSFHDIYPPPDFPSLTFRVAKKIARDIVIEGSGKMAMVQSLDEGKPFIRVAWEFEAVFLHQELRGFCTVVAMKSLNIKPDKETAECLKKAPQFLIVQYPGSTEPADRDIEMWKAVYPQAEALTLPHGEDLFDARDSGLDIWQWVADALRPGIAPDPETKPKEVDVSKPGSLAALIPVFDAKALLKKVKDTIMADMQPRLDRLEQERKETMEKVRKTMLSKGLNPDDLLKPVERTAEEEANPFAAMKKEHAEDFLEIRKQLSKRGLLKPDVEKKIAEAEKNCSDLLTKAAAKYEEHKAWIASPKVMPDWAKKLFADAGIDPEDPRPLRRLTREEVLTRHQSGLGLAGKNLSGLDLSGLDFSGGIFVKANLAKTRFTGSTLDGADLSEARGREADFSGSSMRQARLTRGTFQGAKFDGANLSESGLVGAFLSKASLAGASLRNADLEKAILEGTNLKKADLSGAKAPYAKFFSADVSQANFSGVDLTKAMFLKSKIEEADFRGAAVRSTHFIETKGNKVNFSGADMYNSRIINGSEIKESTFTNVNADKACWMKSDLSGSDFRGTVMDRGIIQECSLAGSDLTGISARETRFTRTDLSDAKMEDVDLFRGSLRKSKLVRTDLKNSNLYSTEFYRTGVGETRLEGANLKMTKLYKRTDLLPEKKEKR